MMKRRAPKRLQIGPAVSRAKTSTRAGRSKTSALTRARVRSGLTIAELADASGLSFVTVWRIEMGARPAVATARALQRALQGRKRT